MNKYQTGGQIVLPTRSKKSNPLSGSAVTGTSETGTNLLQNVGSYFFGLKNSALKPSQYRPTTSTDPNAKYYTWPYLKEDVKRDIVGGDYVKKINTQQANFQKDDPNYLPYYIDEANFDSIYGYLDYTPKKVTMQGSSVNLGQYQLSPGKDSRGRYISIYDKYDWNLLEGMGLKGNSWETYDRIYEDDWNKSSKKKFQTGGSTEFFQSLVDQYQSQQAPEQEYESYQEDSAPDEEAPDYEELYQNYNDLQSQYDELLNKQADIASVENSDTGDGFMDFLFSNSKRNLPLDFDSLPRESRTAPVSNKEQAAFDYFKQKGYADHIAAGIVGNLKHESELSTSAVGDGGKARSLAQWHPDRYNALQRQGFDLNDFYSSLDAIDHELNTSEKGALKSLLNTKTPEEAAAIFDQKYERSAGLSRSKRMEAASNLYKRNSKYQTGGYAATPEEQHIGLNNPNYDSMFFPTEGVNTFRGLDSGAPVHLTDELGNQEVLFGPQHTTQMYGQVAERKYKFGGQNG